MKNTEYQSNKQLGDRGELLAINYLKLKGYKILERNFRCKFGEIDLIAKDKDVIVFVEVKTKRGIDFGLPEEMVNQRKRKKLIKLSQFYIIEKELFNQPIRIDVVAIEMNKNGEKTKTKIRLIKNAVF